MHQDFLPAGIVVLTGAACPRKAASTRSATGRLWNRVNLEEVATIEAWHRDKKKVLDFSDDTRKCSAPPYRAQRRARGIGHSSRNTTARSPS